MINKKHIKNYIVFIAGFLIFLILTLPFYTANVFATGITVKSVYGSNGVQGYRKATDSTNVDVDAQIDGDSSIAPSQVTFGIGDVFNSCGNMGASFNCSYRSSSFTIDAKSYSYTIHLYDDAGTEVITAPATMTVDNIAPTAYLDVLQNGTSADSNISITYSIADTACADSSCTGKCSGIKEIKLYKYDAANPIETIPVNTADCSNEAAISRSASLFNYGNGSTQACVVAYDNIGQASSLVCDGFIVDSSDPEISSLEILSNGEAVTYVGSSGIISDVSVQITDVGTGIDINTARADLSQLNPSYASIVYAAATGGSCELVSGIYYCAWKSININATSGVSINFYADDNAGNNGSAALTYSFSADTSAPQITYIGTNKSYGDLSYASGLHAETVKAIITESGSGLEKENVKLNFQYIGGAASVAAANCSSSSSTYTCIWENIDFSTVDISTEDVKKIWVDSIKDGTGNEATGLTYGEVKIDKTAPVISNIYNISSSGICATSNDELTFYAAVSENSGIAPTFIVDAVSISSLGNITGSCVNVSSTWNCSATVQSLYSTEIEANVNVYAADFAGNPASASVPVTICQLTDTTSPPELVSSSVGTLIPSVGIDRRIVSQTYATVFVPVILTLQPNSEILSMDVDIGNCTSEHLGGTPYVMNEFSTEPYVVFKISSDLSDVDSPISIDCKLNLNMRNGNLIYAKPEVESFSVSIPLYNNALGTVDESVQDKISDIEGEISSLQDKISSMTKWTKWLGMICGIVDLLMKINSILQTLKSIIYIILLIFDWIPVVEVIWKGVCGVISGFSAFFDVLWGKLGVFGTFFRYACLVYTCKLCNFDAWSNVLVNWAGLAVGSKIEDHGGIGGGKIGEELKVKEGTFLSPSFSNAFQITYGSLRPVGTAEIGKDGKATGNYWDGKAYVDATAYKTNTGYDTKELTAYYETSDKSDGLFGNNEYIPTNFYSFPDTGNWLFNPYKSIHYAQWCLCIPGYLYNLRKDVQVKCLYKKCIEEASKSGLPTTTCEQAYAERECLYVEGAAYKEHGIAEEFFSNLLEMIWGNLLGIVLGIAHFVACTAHKYTCVKLETDWWNVACSISGVLLNLEDMKDIFDVEFNDYDYELNTDYCSS